MFRDLVASAAGAGVAVCLVVAGLQLVTTGPLILRAEVFEKAERAEAPAQSAAMIIASTGADQRDGAATRQHGNGAWEPADGVEQTLYTVLADLLVGMAVSLMLLGAMLFRGDPIDGRRGLLWGAVGFVAASLLPSLGLPPELPGTPAADLLARQTWWLGTAFASAGGLYLLAFGTGWPSRIVALALLVAPHAIGAPQPPSQEVACPAELAGPFVAGSLVVSAALWSLSGLASGWLYRRISARG